MRYAHSSYYNVLHDRAVHANYGVIKYYITYVIYETHINCTYLPTDQ